MVCPGLSTLSLHPGLNNRAVSGLKRASKQASTEECEIQMGHIGHILLSKQLEGRMTEHSANTNQPRV